MKIINRIEALRKLERISKAELCRLTGTNRNSYNGYLKTGNVPLNTLERLLDHFGYTILIVDKSCL